MGPLLFLLLATAAPPDDARAWVRRGTEAFEAGDYEVALVAAERAYALDPKPPLLHNLGAVLEALGRFGEAADAFERVIADPSSSERLRATDRARLEALRPSLSSATVRFAPSRAEATVASARSDRGGDQRVAPGPAVLTIRSDQKLVVRNVELPVARRTTIDVDDWLAHDLDAFLDVGTERLRAIVIDGAPLVWVPDPGTRVRLSPGEHTVAWTGREGDEHRRTIEFTPRATVPLFEAPAIFATPPPPAPRSVAPWAVAGSGVALAVTGGVLLAVAHGTAGSVQPEPGTRVAPLTYPEALAHERRAGREAAAGVGLLVAGGVAALSGVVWGLLSAPGDQGPSIAR